MATASDVLLRAARDCYKWLLCPVQPSATDPKIEVESFALNTSTSTFGREIERAATENALVIPTWSPIYLHSTLKEFYWKADKIAVRAEDFYEDTLRYLSLPRLKDRGVLEQTIVKGAATKDYFGTAYGQSGDTFEGFKFGDANVPFDDTLLLIEPEAAKAYEAAHPVVALGPMPPGSTTPEPIPPGSTPPKPLPPGTTSPTPAPVPKAKRFYGSVEVAPATAKLRLVQIAEEIIDKLSSDPNASVKVTLEISADFPAGAPDQVKRAVSENATTLGFKTKNWE